MILRVLIIEDSEDDAALLSRELTKAGYQVLGRRIEDDESLRAALSERSWDVLLADFTLPRYSGIAALQTVKELDLDLPFIMVSGTITDDAAVAAMKTGAHDYIMKDNLSRLAPAVERELHDAAVRRDRRGAERAAAEARQRAEAAQDLAERRGASVVLLRELVAVSLDTLARSTVREVGERMVSAALQLTGAAAACFAYGDQGGEFEMILEDPLGSAASKRLAADAYRTYLSAQRDQLLSTSAFWTGASFLGNLLIDHRNRPNGLLLVSPSKIGSAGEEQRAVLSHLASLASLGLQHIEARETAEARADEAERLKSNLELAARLRQSLVTVGHELISTLSFQEVLSRAVVEGAEALGADAAVLEMREQDVWIVKQAYGLSCSLKGLRLRKEEAPLAAIASMDRAALVVEDARGDPRLFEETRRRYRLLSALVVPLHVGKEIVGVILFTHTTVPGYFTAAHLEFASNLANLIALALQNARLYEQQRTLAHDLETALLNLPAQMPGVEVSHIYCSATEQARVGGDFYDVFEVKRGLVGVLIGDVCGHGVGAARIATLVRDSVYAFAQQFTRPHLVLRETNRLLVKQAIPGFVTAFVGFLSPDSGSMVYASAGHPSPLAQLGDSVRLLESCQLPLGVMIDASYRDYQVTLEPGSMLLLYTDGLTEARQNSDFFGEERLAESLRRQNGHGIESVPRLLLEEVTGFCGGLLADDAAVLAVRYIGLAT